MKAINYFNSEIAKLPYPDYRHYTDDASLQKALDEYGASYDVIWENFESILKEEYGTGNDELDTYLLKKAEILSQDAGIIELETTFDALCDIARESIRLSQQSA